ncbi:ribokinase, partial [Plantactinospora sp. CA-290183]|uniref:ribokinase n=1 Tax=Plantactinospora sp. CA-290183 TaxID=3240006 RepID=UPI003D8FED03
PSINADLVLDVPVLPVPGQTVLGAELRRHGGGKGANQAVAAARLADGADPRPNVRMVGRVGNDDDGLRLRGELSAAGVDVGGVLVDPAESTGVAMILVDGHGENLIAVAPGANAAVGAADVARATSGLGAGDVVVCQLEVPMAAIRSLVTTAAGRGARVVCNAAPAHPIEPGTLGELSALVVNENEARLVLGMTVTDPGTAADAAATAGCAVVVTLGADGAVWADRQGNAGHLAAPVVRAVDTVGAGDAFVGAFAVWLSAGAELARPWPSAWQPARS